MLKPVNEKCFYYMVDYDWGVDGTWSYTSLVDQEELRAPQLGDVEMPIK